MRTTTRNEEEEEETDDFWTIALQHNECCEDLSDDDDDDDDDSDGAHDSVKPTIYRIPSMIQHKEEKGETTTTTTLRLCPLPSTDGVCSPVGADAWYASALLASLFLSHHPNVSHHEKNDHPPSFRHPFSNLVSAASASSSSGCCSSNVIIELGSGAVGLSGFVCALALEAYLRTTTTVVQDDPTPTPGWKILLTDNDAQVLQQLEQNLRANDSVLVATAAAASSSSSSSRRKQATKGLVPQIEVVAWDWKEDSPAATALGHKEHALTPNDNVVLVVGSELVYTEETATACVHLMVRLLRRYPLMELWIVQVTDRYGWWDIVVPTLHQEDMCVEPIPLSPDLHKTAMRMVPMGGALDRHAYGAFCITNNNNKPMTMMAMHSSP